MTSTLQSDVQASQRPRFPTEMTLMKTLQSFQVVQNAIQNHRFSNIIFAFRDSVLLLEHSNVPNFTLQLKFTTFISKSYHATTEFLCNL